MELKEDLHLETCPDEECRHAFKEEYFCLVAVYHRSDITQTVPELIYFGAQSVMETENTLLSKGKRDEIYLELAYLALLAVKRHAWSNYLQREAEYLNFFHPPPSPRFYQIDGRELVLWRAPIYMPAPKIYYLYADVNYHHQQSPCQSLHVVEPAPGILPLVLWRSSKVYQPVPASKTNQPAQTLNCVSPPPPIKTPRKKRNGSVHICAANMIGELGVRVTRSMRRL